MELLVNFVCPDCHGVLKEIAVGLECSVCGEVYPQNSAGKVDFRLRKPKRVEMSWVVNDAFPAGIDASFFMNPSLPKPAVDFKPFPAPRHFTPQLLNLFPKASSPTSKMLDIGCGDGIHKSLGEYAGFQYFGLDYNDPDAPFWGDAHALPFMDQSFDLVIAMAVFQQVRFPMVAMQEVQRVLKPGGVFLGTVSFLEPFHGNGFYHYTILGIENLLTAAGLKINYLAPVQHWSALEAQAHMGLFPKMPATLAGLMVLPTLWLHKLWWKIGARFNPKATEKMRAVTLAGSFQFAAEKL